MPCGAKVRARCSSDGNSFNSSFLDAARFLSSIDTTIGPGRTHMKISVENGPLKPAAYATPSPSLQDTVFAVCYKKDPSIPLCGRNQDANTMTDYPHVSSEWYSLDGMKEAAGFLPGPDTARARDTSDNGRRRSRQHASGGTTAGRILQNGAFPDRFIPARTYMDPTSMSFRVTKGPRFLSAEERLWRRRSPKADPFMPIHSRKAAATQRALQRSIRYRRGPHYGPHLVNDSGIVGPRAHIGAAETLRQISAGAVWNVGGRSAVLGRRLAAVSDGTGGLLESGTTAPMYTARFLEKTNSTVEQRETHESRVALALDIDPATRLLETSRSPRLLELTPSPSSPDHEAYFPFNWKDGAWRRLERTDWTNVIPRSRHRTLPSRPFRVLEAPFLRDDFYSSPLAYSSTSGFLAVGLGSRVYLWSEYFGVQYPPLSVQHPSNSVTSLSFSSHNGGNSILAVARQSGLLSLWSVYESDTRFEISHPGSITCVAFKQSTTRRLSERFPNILVYTEDLAVGDELGNVWYYSVEWTDEKTRKNSGWNGSMTLLAKVSAHKQQICGLAWSPDGVYLATGGNDNACLLFEIREILSASPLDITSGLSASPQLALNTYGSGSRPVVRRNRNPYERHPLVSHVLPSWMQPHVTPVSTSILTHTGSLISGHGRTIMVPPNRQKHRLAHSAAVKAIAFAPWQPSLLATGGGSNDRAIHFFHTPSGICLATINVFAQVTSLIWSKTRPEIVATFGYAQPEHPFRIAVFAWPSCEQIAAIPWGPHGTSSDHMDTNYVGDCGRAIWAISYPGWLPDMPEDGPVYPEWHSSQAPATSDHPDRLQEGRPGQSWMSTFMRPKEKEGGLWCSRTTEEGCIIVASSDSTVKFHEVWCGSKKGIVPASGLLGGSQILEELEGIEKTGRDVIR
ncbi:hypothetical protein ASPZODRAFT_135495 [Penicilliopsis zonata CBS 506.65]|uniref:Uncharacterized protein n=1 Tax=Penicilliopsis zonata CBS 506.65 TaxID=1073090 RepID=A0A1L9SA48_9EURO|nr:hypothetical protein ASPZODRAFT_135495 [Penicilliopsis zonata CBS 506.65]OJJ44050.1 hypothetical protein ASPZODRAFT_135495 [Penicilliopsis zonata CBS 506.65]